MSTIKPKKYYINLAKKIWEETLVEEAQELAEMGYVRSERDDDLWVLPKTGSKLYLTDCASDTYAKILNSAEEVAGYYLWLHEDDALKDWKANTKGIKFTETDKEVDRILEELCA